MKTLLLSASMLVLAVSAGHSQVRFEFTPRAGVFFGSRNIFVGAHESSPPYASAFLRHRAAPGAGLRMTTWLTRHVGVELDGWYTTSGLQRGVSALNLPGVEQLPGPWRLAVPGAVAPIPSYGA